MSETEDMEGSATPPCDPGGDVATAEGDLSPGATPGDFISTDRGSYSIGDVALVSWDIRTRPLHERDFIGLFEVEEGVEPGHMTGCVGHMLTEVGHLSMERLLDSRLRGDTSVCSGQLQWALSAEILPKCKSCDNHVIW